MDCADEGYVTGAKDGKIRLWDTDFKPITKIDLTQASDGYQGIIVFHILTSLYIRFHCVLDLEVCVSCVGFFVLMTNV